MTKHSEVSRQKAREDLIVYINFKLAALGQPYFVEKESHTDTSGQISKKFIDLTENLIQNYQESARLLSDHYCPADERIQNFLRNYLKDTKTEKPVCLPNKTFILDQAGLAREISLPPDKNVFDNGFVTSHRIKQGILNNPIHDRRTTEGSFHIVEGGLPIPPDKKEVPKIAFAGLLNAAANPPDEILELPFTSTQEEKAKLFVSLLLRPTVVPEVEEIMSKKSMEIRFFVPGGLVSNLDFVEHIFGNAGDPHLITNDAALDFDNWTGHTGCIILAPHLTKLKKKDLGLPNINDATERQKRDGMCWSDSEELYNDGKAFKITCRDESGVVVTLIADNYYGYSKKEIKTQISYAANLYGLAEEEHAGGAIAFPRKNLGEAFNGERFLKKLPHEYSFEEVKKIFGNIMDVQPENYAIDNNFNNVIYIPENSHINLYEQKVSWTYKNKRHSIKLLPEYYYVHPTGYKLHMEKHPAAPSWRLVSTYAEGVFCHKPCTVSGGGKSEISKSLLNNIIYGSFYIHDRKKDFEMVDKIFNYDYKNRWKDSQNRTKPSRPILSPKRSLGSVVKLLTPSSYCTDEYNQFLESIPDHVKALVLFIKQFYRPERDGKNWRDYFSVNKINGRPGHELYYNDRPIVASYLRVGFEPDSTWHLNKVRSDFVPAAKLQMEDDITASVTLPASNFEYLHPDIKNESLKITENCESYFFQRPDEAIHRGFDKQAEQDLSGKDVFITNYEPLTTENAKELIEDAIGFDKYTKPVQKLIKKGSKQAPDSFFITPSHPRIVNGKPSKNPRYLQENPYLQNDLDRYLAEIGIRLFRKIPLFKPVHYPVNAVLPGRRNNPPDFKAGIRPLSVYNPIHYQELPELFMDFICSLTGKSPSTTGAGSEGALTKGPFNMLIPTTDLNNALLSYILTGYNGFSTPAGHIGTDHRVDHDISILIPELWCRLDNTILEPSSLLKEGSLEKLEDFDHNGRKVLASRLGYRITDAFLFRYMGRIFDEPQSVFPEKMLRPENQDMDAFVDGIENIVEAQRKVALNYFEDGSIESAIPPLKVLLHIMAYGHYENRDIADPELRAMFKRENVLNSDWYKERLKIKQQRDIELWEKRIEYANGFMKKDINKTIAQNMNLDEAIRKAKENLDYYKSKKYLTSLVGTIGADPLYKG